MSGRRAHELQRYIRRSLTNPELDPWVARELRRTSRRLAKIHQAEARAERRAERESRRGIAIEGA